MTDVPVIYLFFVPHTVERQNGKLCRATLAQSSGKQKAKTKKEKREELFCYHVTL
jgi:hypothetical protein